MFRFIVLASAVFVQCAFGQYLPGQCNCGSNYNINNNNIDLLNAGIGGINGINSINAIGINGISGINAAGIGAGGVSSLSYAAPGPAQSLGNFGGYGTGEVTVVGDLPLTGSTNVAGSLPVIGTVLFNGNVPAGGVVSIIGNSPYCCCN